MDVSDFSRNDGPGGDSESETDGPTTSSRFSQYQTHSKTRPSSLFSHPNVTVVPPLEVGTGSKRTKQLELTNIPYHLVPSNLLNYETGPCAVGQPTIGQMEPGHEALNSFENYLKLRDLHTCGLEVQRYTPVGFDIHKPNVAMTLMEPILGYRSSDLGTFAQIPHSSCDYCPRIHTTHVGIPYNYSHMGPFGPDLLEFSKKLPSSTTVYVPSLATTVSTSVGSHYLTTGQLANWTEHREPSMNALTSVTSVGLSKAAISFGADIVLFDTHPSSYTHNVPHVPTNSTSQILSTSKQILDKLRTDDELSNSDTSCSEESVNDPDMSLLLPSVSQTPFLLDLNPVMSKSLQSNGFTHTAGLQRELSVYSQGNYSSSQLSGCGLAINGELQNSCPETRYDAEDSLKTYTQSAACSTVLRQSLRLEMEGQRPVMTPWTTDDSTGLQHSHQPSRNQQQQSSRQGQQQQPALPLLQEQQRPHHTQPMLLYQQTL
ncbi:hypothetical protein PHET_06523 [Paragonimus heterotremus]|uniref:Uncharacterized protein n=1 Tax=Paragonimus heterotremus TaxID=100268 RepID=A0A8J4WG90_9TREM|nr:hypothetical protein PHET_06523 [Paragonimus heterotremus]